MLISMVYMMLLTRFKPYNEDSDDELAALGQWGLVITLLAALMFKLDVSQKDNYSGEVYAVLVYVSLIIPPATAVYEALAELLPFLPTAGLTGLICSASTVARMERKKKRRASAPERGSVTESAPGRNNQVRPIETPAQDAESAPIKVAEAKPVQVAPSKPDDDAA